MKDKPIILASASPRRREILTLGGVPFEVCPAMDEQAPEGLAPADLVRALARSKASQVAVQYADRVILGADTMVVLDDKMLGKPTSKPHAVEMLMSLQGREHQVMTGVWCIRTNEDNIVVKEDGFTDIATVKFFPMTHEEAEEYVATGEPMDKASGRIWNTDELIKTGWMDESGNWKTRNGNQSECFDKAGAYGIQGYGMRFVEGINGDFYTVMGLPAGRLLRFLRDFQAD